MSAAGVRADFSRTCEGCEYVKSEPWPKGKTGYRCFASGPCQGYHIGTDHFLPYIPAWCPLMQAEGMKETRGARELTHLSLFSGIGGLDLAAERAGFRSIGQCEWADYKTRVLEKHWPAVHRWRDIRTLTQESLYARTGKRTVDLISGGFPCQPFSCAGKRRGREDDRYLWPEMLRVIQEIRPTWVVGENVANIVNMALDTVLSDLERQGYTVQAFILPACAVDAPHRRDRCAIVAYSNGERCEKFKSPCITGKEKSTGGPDHEGRKDASDTDRTMLESAVTIKDAPGRARPTDNGALSYTDDRSGAVRRDRKLPAVEETGGGRDHIGGRTQEHGSGERRTAQPGVGGSHDGLSAWMDGVRPGWADGSWEYGIERIARDVSDRVNRLKCLGNAVVPAQFYPIFQAIADIERSGA